MRLIYRGTVERAAIIAGVLTMAVLWILVGLVSPASLYEIIKRTGEKFPEGREYDPFRIRRHPCV